MADRIQQRRDTAARWAQYNPVLLEGELGWVIDNPNQFKIGDGVKAWNDLPLRGFSGINVQETSSSDLEFADEQGNTILRLKDGHIQTKNFNSEEQNVNVQETSSFVMGSDVLVVMHRAGICTTNYNGTNVYPEESIWSLMAAQRCGVKYVEFDLRETSDKKLVCIHDDTINRTMQLKNGGTISGSVLVSSLTLTQIKNNYVYKSSIPQYRTPIITLEEFCDACRRLELIPYYHGDNGGNYDYVMQVMHDYCGDFALFLAGTSKLNDLVKARKKYPNALIVYDSLTNISATDMISALKQIGGKCGCSTMNASYTSKSYCDAIRKEGFYVQCSIHNGSLLQSLQNGCNMILDNWSIPYQSGGAIKVIDTADNIDEFNITGGSIENGTITLATNNTISIAQESIYLGGFDLCICFIGNISIKTTGTSDQVISSSDVSTPVVLRKATIKDTAPITITARTNTTVYSISYKQYKF